MNPVIPTSLLPEESQQFALQTEPNLLPYLTGAATVHFQGAARKEKEEKQQTEPQKPTTAGDGIPALLRDLLPFWAPPRPSKN